MQHHILADCHTHLPEKLGHFTARHVTTKIDFMFSHLRYIVNSSINQHDTRFVTAQSSSFGENGKQEAKEEKS
jgi:hypothetical protein